MKFSLWISIQILISIRPVQSAITLDLTSTGKTQLSLLQVLKSLTARRFNQKCCLNSGMGNG